ncbi:hypothetical protein [Paracidovorax avenae]|uniref:hypothetical protein n=1 Tax=Paracidovorax avenae TaxID=80867 RepID=UPI0006B338FF|nr:hypothetical protein [Paracidovorax avenae]
MRSEDEAKSLQDEINRWKLGIVGAASLAVVAYAAWFGLRHGLILSDGPGTWGEFGDFLGGLLNPLVAFAAFYWLTRSVQLQKSELEESRRALEESSEAQKQQAEQGRVSVRLDALMSAHTLATNDLLQLEDRYRSYQLQLAADKISSTTYQALSLRLDGLDAEILEVKNALAAYRKEIREILARYPLPAPT